MNLNSPDPVVRFFSFMQERESIRLKKAAGAPWPWTEDPILRDFKFTNVKREHDRTSFLLIEEFYKPNYNAPREQLLLNCAIARYFGTIEFMRAIGWQQDFKPTFLKKVARDRMAKGERVYTGAYIVTSGNRSGPKEETVVDIFLSALWKRRSLLVYQKLTGSSTLHWTEWRPFISVLMETPGFGGSGFVAKEVTLDTRYTSFWGVNAFGVQTPADKNTWTPIGPGTMRGAARIHGYEDQSKATPTLTLATCIDLFKRRRAHLPKDFIELELHDIAFQLCEFDKRERVRLGQGRPRSRYYPPGPMQRSFL